MAKKPIQKDALNELLAAASSKVLTDLIRQLTIGRPDVRRECFEFLKSQVQVSKALKGKSEGEIVLALWAELEPDLEELDDYGGGSYDVEDHVADLLDQIRMQLESKRVAAEYRQEILTQVLPFIKSGNAGMDDPLYEVAYAACYDNADLRGLAEAFEAMKDEWKVGRARDIYRRVGDRDKYLYLSGLGNLTISATRKEYIRKARVMAKVRHMLVEELGDETRWIRYAEKIKRRQCKAAGPSGGVCLCGAGVVGVEITWT